MRLFDRLPLRYRFSILRFLIYRATRESTLRRMLRTYFKRPEWLYYPGAEIEPIKHFTISPRPHPQADDVSLCKRLITAYQAARDSAAPLKTVSGLWQEIIDQSYQGLVAALEAGDVAKLTDILAGMFQEPFLYGISSAQSGLEAENSFFIRVRTVEELLALAEALGLVRTEAPEQGVLGYGLSEGLPSLVKRIEGVLGISLDFPRVGGAYGLLVENALITPETPEHIYVASRINEAIGRHVQTDGQQALKIVEIGAGFGGTAHWLMRLRRRTINSYSIVDLPLMNVCQGYFLAKVFGTDSVQLYGEAASPTRPIRIMPVNALEQIAPDGFHVLINENSMPEIPESVVKDYLTWAQTKLQDIFYSYNQEAFSPVNGVPQTLVPKAVSDVGGFRRLSRNYSWVRRGYVEEVYTI